MTFNMSEEIYEIAKYHYKLRIRLAGVPELIASETKYHLACFSAFKRLSEKAKQDTNWSLLNSLTSKSTKTTTINEILVDNYM